MQTRTRTLAILAVLVLTAGCLAAPGTPSALDADEHERALGTAGSYTYTVDSVAAVNGRTTGTSNLTVAVDLDAGRTFVETGSSFGPVETYVVNGSVTQRIGGDGGQYRTLDTNVSASEVVPIDVGAVLANHSFEATGVAVIDGQQVRTYEARTTGTNATLDRDLGEGVTVDSVRTTLSVRGDGLVLRMERKADLSIDGGAAEGTYTRTVTFTDVGSTEVPKPEWVSDARNATSSSA